jgi:hypothetical protein
MTTPPFGHPLTTLPYGHPSKGGEKEGNCTVTGA